MLKRWNDLILEHAEDLAALITLENGKALVDAKSEILYAASFLEWFSGEAVRTYGDVISASIPGNEVFTVREPVGPCALITPLVAYAHLDSPSYLHFIQMELSSGNDHQVRNSSDFLLYKA